MSRSRMMREDPDVQKTLNVIKRIHNFGAAIPVISSGLSEAMERTGCNGKTFALALMALYGSTSSSQYVYWKDEFPADIYAAWEVLEKARGEANPSAYIFASGNIEAQKLALVNFVRDMEEGRYEQLKGQWSGMKILNELAGQLTALNRAALASQAWRNLPPALVDAFIGGMQELVVMIPYVESEAALGKSVEDLRLAIEKDKKPRPEDIPAAVDPDSKFAKLKDKSKKRFKL